MQIANYDKRAVFKLSSSEFILLGRPEAVHVEFLNNGIGWLRLKAGHQCKLRSNRNSDKGAFPFLGQIPPKLLPEVPLFGLQPVETKADGNGLLVKRPDFGVPVAHIERSRGRVKAKEPVADITIEAAVQALNAHKRAAKDNLQFSIGTDGLIEVMVSYK